MAYQEKTYAQLVDEEKAQYQARIPEADLSEGSSFDIEARVHASAVFGNQAQGSYLLRQILPDTADGGFLERHAALRGIPNPDPVAARGRVGLRIDTGGVPPIVQPAGTEISHASGITYTLDEDATVENPTWGVGVKTVGTGATISRFPILPDVADMKAGDRFSIGAEEFVIRRVLTSIQSIEIFGTADEAPSVAAALVPIAGAYPVATASDAADDTNRALGETGSMSATSGISPTVEFLSMAGGSDRRTVDQTRADVGQAMAVRPASGNLEDYRRWALESGVGVDRAFIYPGLRGLGTITVVPQGVRDARQLGDERMPEILAYINARKNADDDVEVLTWAWQSGAQAIEVLVTPTVGSEPDWEGSMFTSFLSPANYLRVSSAADLAKVQIGDRLVAPVTVDGILISEERVVAAVEEVGPTDFRIYPTVNFSGTVPISSEILSGGPAYSTIATAIDDLFDSLGTGDTGEPSRYPPAQGDAPGLLRVADIICAIQALDAAKDVSVVTPSANVIVYPLFQLRGGEVRVRWQV